MQKDTLASGHEEEAATPDVEIPGTKLGLKTVVEITRNVFGIYPKHISGDIVVPVPVVSNTGSSSVSSQATVTIYVTQGRNRSPAIRIGAVADDVGTLVRRTAETVLGQVNPYVLAVYREAHHEYEKAIEIVRGIIQDSSEKRRYREAAFLLWGNALQDQGKNEEAIAQYRKALQLDPKSAAAYYNWGNAFNAQGKHDEAMEKFRKANALDPKLQMPY
jgi:TPR repeat